MKTTINKKDPRKFLEDVAHDQRRQDSLKVLRMMEEITGEPPKMWGDSIIGFGQYHYKYESGREGDFFLTGFSPRKTSLSIYIMSGFARFPELMPQLGKHKTGKSCLYISNLEDIDTNILTELITKSVTYMKQKYPGN